jgi:4-hydroxybenzoate polyprenyltransferase
MNNIIYNERTKLLAAFLNAAAGSSFTVGVLAPIAAAFYSVTGSSGIALRTIIIGVVIWLFSAAALHLAARHVLGGLKE